MSKPGTEMDVVPSVSQHDGNTYLIIDSEMQKVLDEVLAPDNPSSSPPKVQVQDIEIKESHLDEEHSKRKVHIIHEQNEDFDNKKRKLKKIRTYEDPSQGNSYEDQTSIKYHEATTSSGTIFVIDDDTIEQNDNPVPKPAWTSCRCKNNLCLKVSCECFSSGSLCKNCKCVKCFNNEFHSKERNVAIKAYMDFNPVALKKVPAKVKQGIVRGCTCAVGYCQKLKCRCYKMKTPCSSTCMCIGCRNVDVTIDHKIGKYPCPVCMSVYLDIGECLQCKLSHTESEGFTLDKLPPPIQVYKKRGGGMGSNRKPMTNCFKKTTNESNDNSDTIIIEEQQITLSEEARQNNHGGKRNIDMWKRSALLRLIKLLKKYNYHALTDSEIKNMNLWNYLAYSLQSHLSGVTPRQVQRKVSNLKMRFESYCIARETGIKVPKRPILFHKQYEMFNGKPYTGDSSSSEDSEEESCNDNDDSMIIVSPNQDTISASNLYPSHNSSYSTVVWNDDSTSTLLYLLRENININGNIEELKKDYTWDVIASQLQGYIPNLAPIQAYQRFRALRSQFRRFQRKNQNTHNVIPPPCYNALNDLMRDIPEEEDDQLSETEIWPPVALGTKSNHGGVRDFKMWTDEATIKLVNLVKANYRTITEKRMKPGAIWRIIASEMKDVMPNITATQVNTKWNALKLKFRKYEDRPIDSYIQPPPCYELIRQFLSRVEDSDDDECNDIQGSINYSLFDSDLYTKGTLDYHGDSEIDLWSNEALIRLLNLVKEYEHILNDDDIVKKDVWTKISTEMRDVVPDLKGKQVEGKFQNLKEKFYKYEKHKNSVSGMPAPKPPCYRELYELLKKKPFPADLEKDESSDNDYSDSSDYGSDVDTSQNSFEYDEKIHTNLVNMQIVQYHHEGQNNHGGIRDHNLWTEEAVMRLINLIKRYFHHFTENHLTRHQIWRILASEMQDMIPGIKGKQVEMKFRNLRRKLKNFENKKKKIFAMSGRESFFCTPEFDYYNELKDLCKRFKRLRWAKPKNSSSPSKDVILFKSLLDAAPEESSSRGHGGYRDRNMWNEDVTKRFVELVRDNYHILTEKQLPKKSFWNRIAEAMQDDIPNITGKQVSVKFQALKAKVKKLSYKNSEISMDDTPNTKEAPSYLNLVEMLENTGSNSEYGEQSNSSHSSDKKSKKNKTMHVYTNLIDLLDGKSILDEDSSNEDGALDPLDPNDPETLKPSFRKFSKFHKGFHGARDHSVWNNNAVSKLISLVQENDHHFNENQMKKGEVWAIIAKGMQHLVPNLSNRTVERKFMSLKTRFLNYEESKKKPGFSCVLKPPCYKELYEFIRGEPFQEGDESLDSYKPSFSNFSKMNRMKSTTESDYYLLLTPNREKTSTESTTLFPASNSKSAFDKYKNSIKPYEEEEEDDSCSGSKDDSYQSNSGLKYGHGGARDFNMWTDDAVEKLLYLAKENEHHILSSISKTAVLDFSHPNFKECIGKKKKKQQVWQDIANEMQDVMPGLNGRQAQGKFHTLRTKFRNFEIKRSCPGGSCLPKPFYYSMLYELLKGKPLNEDGYSSDEDSVFARYQLMRKEKAAYNDPFKWTSEVTSKLVDLVIDNFHYMQGKLLKKDQFWAIVANMMRKEVSNVSFKDIDKKFLSLKQFCLRYENRREKGLKVDAEPIYHRKLLEFIQKTKPKRPPKEQTENGGGNGHGGLRDRSMWSKSAMKHLVYLASENYEFLFGSGVRTHVMGFVWKQIASEMQEFMPEVESKQCKQKFHAMLSKYEKYESEHRFTKIKKPPCYRRLRNLIKNKNCAIGSEESSSDSEEYCDEGYSNEEQLIEEEEVIDDKTKSAMVEELFSQQNDNSQPDQWTVYGVPDTSRHGGHRDRNMWSKEAVQKLINIMKENYYIYKSNEKPKGFWNIVAEQMQDLVPNLDANQAVRKFLNLKRKYSEYTNSNTYSRVKAPPCYEDLCELFDPDSELNTLLSDQQEMKIEFEQHEVEDEIETKPELTMNGWKDEHILQLLKLVKENYDDSNYDPKEQGSVWRNISQFMCNQIPGITAEAIKEKFVSLVKEYYSLEKQIKENKYIKVPIYYETLRTIFAEENEDYEYIEQDQNVQTVVVKSEQEAICSSPIKSFVTVNTPAKDSVALECEISPSDVAPNDHDITYEVQMSNRDADSYTEENTLDSNFSDTEDHVD